MEFRQIARIRQFIAIQYKALGDPKQAVAMSQSIVREGDRPGEWGNVINASRSIAHILVSWATSPRPMRMRGGWRRWCRRRAAAPCRAGGSWYPMYGNSWESDADAMRAMIFEARGQYREADRLIGRAEAFRRAAVKDIPRFEFPPPPEQILLRRRR